MFYHRVIAIRDISLCLNFVLSLRLTLTLRSISPLLIVSFPGLLQLYDSRQSLIKRTFGLNKSLSLTFFITSLFLCIRLLTCILEFSLLFSFFYLLSYCWLDLGFSWRTVVIFSITGRITKQWLFVRWITHWCEYYIFILWMVILNSRHAAFTTKRFSSSFLRCFSSFLRCRQLLRLILLFLFRLFLSLFVSSFCHLNYKFNYKIFATTITKPTL